ncbi:MAG: fibronectin type III domain-containing protein, partial [Nanoarchaeota archaeon]|nr:fibronectin type III domain-containing protein [Nanoarchaeota archaeon]
WKTNIPSYSIVSFADEAEFNLLSSNPYVGEVSQTDKKVNDHLIELRGLRPNTRYHFQAKSFSIAKAIGRSENLTFVTKTSKITPIVSDVRKNSITIAWSTNEPASSIVEYTNMKTGVRERKIIDKKTTAHSVLIENLDQDTSYQIETSGINEQGNLVESKSGLVARTLKDITPPDIVSLKIENALLPGRNDLVQTVITWKTNELASSIVEFQAGATKTGETLEQREEKKNLFTTDHSFVLTKFRPGGVYQIRAVSKDEAGNIGASPIRMIVTPRETQSIFDVVIRNFEDTFQFVRKLK